MPAPSDPARKAPPEITIETLFGGFGVFACMLIFTGVLKSLPGVANAPIDITPVLLGINLLHLAFALASRCFALPATVPVLFLLHATFATLAIISAATSPGRDIFPDKLRDVVLVAPVMMAIGVAVAADPRAFRRFLLAAKVIGPAMGGFIAAAFALGLVNVVVQFGGRGNLQTQRVQYQLANLLIALAACAYSIDALRTRGLRRLASAGMTALMAFAALIPGGRSGFIGLCLTVVVTPCLYLWHRGRRGLALALAATLAVLVGLGIGLLLASAQFSSGLRTVERFTQGTGGGDGGGRLALWQAAFALVGGNSWMGVGFGGYTPAAGWGVTREYYPHNLFIESLVELGLPGFSLFLAIWLTAGLGWLLARRHLGNDKAGAEQWAATAGFGLIMLIYISVSTDLGNPLMWFALGLVAGCGGASSSRWAPPPALARA
jgi:O-antigen ligase